MNKYGWLFITISLTLLITLIADQVAGLTAAGITDSLPSSTNILSGDNILGFLNTYWGLLTFNVAGIPSIVSLFFIPLNLIMGYILLETLIKAFDAVIPL